MEEKRTGIFYEKYSDKAVSLLIYIGTIPVK
jgi:hypothetical protein